MWSIELLMSTVRQVEYYFSAQNLLNDKYMRGLMDNEGWVPIMKIMSFRRMILLQATDPSRVALAIHVWSQTVEVDMKSQRIRAKAPSASYLWQMPQNFWINSATNCFL